MSTTRGANKSLPSGFQGASRACQTAPRLSRFPIDLGQPLSPGDPIPGAAQYCQQEQRTLAGAHATVPDLACVTTRYPRPGPGILTRFPFDRRNGIKHSHEENAKEPSNFRTVRTYLLGSTHPCPIAVHMEPFPTSAFKVLS